MINKFADTLPTERLYMGIDPGVKGSISIINGEGSIELIVELENMKCRDISLAFDSIMRLWNRRRRLTTIMEKVGGYKEGSKGNIGSRMFTFGASYGRLQMAMASRGIPWREVVPTIWQKDYNLPKGLSYQENKRKLKKLAQGVVS